MCGILAVLNFSRHAVDLDTLLRMRDTMSHRGPDDAGVFVDSNVGLAHRRLSIIDLSKTGSQPMANEDASLILVFNGEIYNYLELKDVLVEKGHRFRSSSDTEVILHAYEEYGADCLHHFNGMFGFVIWDRRKRKIFAARDRIGIKPVYYFLDNRRLIIASEAKAIIEDRTVPREPDSCSISDIFFAGRPLGDRTLFKHIKELEPGYFLEADEESGRIAVKKYWDVVYDYKRNRSESDFRDELASLLDDAVMVHCRSDASLGCHLSGGLDSSTVVCLAARHRDHLKTFSIKFSEEAHIDETRYAKEVARSVHAEYIEDSPQAESFARLLPFLVWHMDTGMANEGGFSYFTVSDLAHKHVKVSLTGHGGDEIFAGYPAQFLATFGHSRMFDLHHDPTRVFKERFFTRMANALRRRKTRGLWMAVRNRIAPPPRSLEDLWIQLHCGSLPAESPIFTREFRRDLGGYCPREEYVRPLKEAPTDQILDKCLYHDLRVYLPSLLHQEDRVSMAVSIESRVPLLDYRIVEFLAGVPPEIKVKRLEPKYLLKQVGSSILPKNILSRRDKRPFPVPGTFWLTSEMRKLIQDVLFSRESLQRGLFKPATLTNALENVGLIWQLLNLELWFQIFIDGNQRWLREIPTSTTA